MLQEKRARMQTRTRFRLVGVLCLILVSVPVTVWGQMGDSPWKRHTLARMAAYQQDTSAEAEAVHQEAEEPGQDDDDAHLATELNNWAEVYRDQGQYTEAELLYQRALEIREKALGPEHPDVAVSLNNLAEMYHTQGKYGEAESLFLRSLAIREKVLGPEHPDVDGSLNNIASWYHDQGKYAEAVPL
ncbi:MAG: tetratricopeptide repeat protein, partial [Acidobacteria bacterium]|nr:tetratricopeptide repeat protein [Acidobacteriota bacterium]